MKTYITSDLHFNHRNILKFCPRVRGEYADVEHMNRSMIEKWNSIVEPQDLVYNLGDVSFGSSAKTLEILTQLNGRQILIKGNHDSSTLKDKRCRAMFEHVFDYLEVDVNGLKVVMFHYPIWEWRNCHKGSVHFYGHIHDSIAPMPGRQTNVGYDYTGRIVCDLEKLVDQVVQVDSLQTHHGKADTVD